MSLVGVASDPQCTANRLSFEFTLHHNFSQTSKHIDLLICYERCLILILESQNKDSSRNTTRDQGFVKRVINATEKYSSIIVQITNDPLSYLSKVFSLEIFDQFIYSNIRERGKNARINFSTNRVSLNLIENTTPVREMLINKFYQDLVIIFNTF